MARGLALLVLLLVLGAGGGFAASWVLGEHPPGEGAAAPVAAASPSLPLDPVPAILDDPAYAPLEVSVPLDQQKVGEGDFTMTVPVPAGWDFFPNSLNEWQWRPPGQPSFGYLMRVEQVLSNRRSIDWTLDRRIDELNEDEQGVKILGQGPDSLHFTFVTNNHRRHGYLKWLDITGSDNAQVEIAVTGREVDEPGLADLIARVAEGVRLG